MLDRRFSGSFLMYMLAFGVAGLSPLILLPFMTRSLSASEFGIAALFVTLCQLTANFSSLGTHGYVSVQYFKGETRGWGSSVAAAVTVIAGVHIGLLVVSLVAGNWIAAMLSMPTYAIALLILASALLCSNFVYLAMYQSTERPQFYLAARCIQAVLEIGLCLGVIYLLSPTAEARIYTFPIALAGAGLLGIYYGVSTRAFVTDNIKSSIKGALRFGLPMLPHVAAGTLISFLDRLIIASVMGPEQLGVYMAAAQLGLVMLLVIEPFNKAYAPWLFSQLANNTAEARTRIVRFTYLFFAALLVAGLLAAIAALLSYDIVVGQMYEEGRAIVPLIITGYVVQGMYYTVVNYLFYTEKTHILSGISVTTMATGAGISYALVSTFGLFGAAASLVINNTILFVLVWFFASREIKLPWFSGSLMLKRDA